MKIKEVGAKDGGKRTKAEQVEHKHAHPEVFNL